MKNFLMSAMALTAVLIVPGVASADQAADRSAAIAACRAEVQAQVGQDAVIRLDNMRLRAASARVDLDVIRDGRSENVRCEVSRQAGGSFEVASITPTLQTASAAASTGQ
jgi:hypothetical protein